MIGSWCACGKPAALSIYLFTLYSFFASALFIKAGDNSASRLACEILGKIPSPTFPWLPFFPASSVQTKLMHENYYMKQ